MRSLVVLGVALLGPAMLAAYQGPVGTTCASAKDSWKSICRQEQHLAAGAASEEGGPVGTGSIDRKAPRRSTSIDRPPPLISNPATVPPAEHNAAGEHPKLEGAENPEPSGGAVALPRPVRGGDDQRTALRGNRKGTVRPLRVDPAAKIGSASSVRYSRKQIPQQAIAGAASPRKVVTSAGQPRPHSGRAHLADRHGRAAEVVTSQTSQTSQTVYAGRPPEGWN